MSSLRDASVKWYSFEMSLKSHPVQVRTCCIVRGVGNGDSKRTSHVL